MKRALAATLFGGLLICGIPQAAFAHEEAGNPPPAASAPADKSGHDEASKPADDSGRPKQDPPGEGRSHYDKLHHDGDTF